MSYYARPHLVKALEQRGLAGFLMHLLQLRGTARGHSDVVAYKLRVTQLVRLQHRLHQYRGKLKKANLKIESVLHVWVADARWYLRVVEP